MSYNIIVNRACKDGKNASLIIIAYIKLYKLYNSKSYFYLAQKDYINIDD